jgi:voltage-gated potassium channel
VIDKEVRTAISRIALAILYVVAAGLIYALAPMTGDLWWLAAITGPLAALMLIPLAFLASRRILASQEPLLTIGYAVVVSLTVLVLGFSTTYYALEKHDSAQFESLETKLDAVYFSVTTLSTVGFGDVHATGQLGRGIVVAQVAADFLFVVVVVGIIRWSGKRRVDAGRRDVRLRDELRQHRDRGGDVNQR